MASTRLDMDATWGGFIARVGRLPTLPLKPEAAGGSAKLFLTLPAESALPPTPRPPAEEEGPSVDSIIRRRPSSPSAEAMEEVSLTLRR